MPIPGFTAAEIAARVPKARKTTDGWRAPCPVHGGDNPDAFHIFDTADGAVVKCHSQDCSIADIAKALGIESTPKASPNRTGQETTYDYTDGEGNLLFQVVRLYKNGKKTFRQRRPDAAKPSGYIWKMADTERVLYRLPRVLEAVQAGETILIVEGEKDVFAAEQLGFTATTNPGGAGKWLPAHSETLRGAPVAILPDNDEPGRKHTQQVVASLQGVASSIKIVELPGLPPKGDLFDWVEAGGKPEELAALIEAAEPIEAGQELVLDEPEDGRPTIYHDPRDITSAVDETATALMSSGAPIWQRDGLMVSVKSAPREASHGLKPDTERLRIVPVKGQYVQELATSAANHMVKSQFRKGEIHFKPDSCPIKTIEALDARMTLPFDVLSGIVTVPTLRHDGSVITNLGYDKETGLFYKPQAQFPPIPENPTIDDARRAIEKLREPFCDFWFAEPWHESAAIAAILSIMCRHMVDNVPLMAVSSSTRGIGKGLLVDIISIIATGSTAALSGYPRDDAEMEKQLLVIGMNADKIICFDNIIGAFGGGSIDKALTGQLMRGRLLGFSKDVEVKLATTFFVTGNSLRFKGDTTRRTLPITLEAKVQNPETREGFRHVDLKRWVSDNQSGLTVAAITIVKAYIDAGMPGQDITPYGSFERWSALVRASLVWAGMPDPCEGRKSIESDHDAGFEQLEELLRTWEAAYPEGKHTLKDIVGAVKQEADREQKQLQASQPLIELGNALAGFDPKSKGKASELNTSSLSQKLPVDNGASRIIDGKRLRYEKDARLHRKMYWIETLAREGTDYPDDDTASLQDLTPEYSEYDDTGFDYGEYDSKIADDNELPF